jgi:cation:H+ antiporter
VFGATIVTAVLTIEDLFLTVRPIRLGVPEIGIGNVIGSLIFSVTGHRGPRRGQRRDRLERAALAPPGALRPDRRRRGLHVDRNLKRWHGFVLLALYIAYWIVSFVVYGGAPVED